MIKCRKCGEMSDDVRFGHCKKCVDVASENCKKREGVNEGASEGVNVMIENENGDKLSLEVNSGGIEDWVDCFKAILTFLTFHPETIAEAFREEQ